MARFNSRGTGSSPQIEITGLAELRKELLAFDKALVREMDKTIRETDASLLSKVREEYPESALDNWTNEGRLAYSKPVADKNIKLKQGSRKRGSQYKVLKQLSQESPAAVIFDRAGRKNAPKNDSGVAFIAKLNEDFGTITYRWGSRAIWRGFSKWGGFERYNKAILKKYEKAKEEFEKRANN